MKIVNLISAACFVALAAPAFAQDATAPGEGGQAVRNLVQSLNEAGVPPGKLISEAVQSGLNLGQEVKEINDPKN
jgi:hypothetical protein